MVNQSKGMISLMSSGEDILRVISSLVIVKWFLITDRFSIVLSVVIIVILIILIVIITVAVIV